MFGCCSGQIECNDKNWNPVPENAELCKARPSVPVSYKIPLLAVKDGLGPFFGISMTIMLAVG